MTFDIKNFRHVNNILDDTDVEQGGMLIDKLVPLEGITAISAHPNAGKTWFYFFLALSVAKGEKFLNEFGTNKQRVLIVDEENTKFEIKRRLEMINAVRDVDIFCAYSNGIKLDEDDCMASLIEIIKKNKIGLVIIDPFIAFHSKEENNARDIQSVMECLDEIKRAGATVIFIHHHRKDGTSARGAQSLRGSSAFSGRVDSHLSLEKVSDGEEIKIILKQEKFRSGKRIEPINITIFESEGKMNIRHDGKKEPEKLKNQEAEEIILNILADKGSLDREQVYLELKKQIEIGERNTFDALQQLEKKKIILSNREGKKKVYSVNFIKFEDDLFGEPVNK